MLDIFLDVTPTPKARPRMTRDGHVYNPLKTEQAERDIQFLLKAHIIRLQIQITDKPVVVSMIFHHDCPKTMNKSDRLLADLGMLYKASKPDIDNLAKLVADAMNGLIYFDDAQIVKLTCEKKYSKREGVELKVIEM